MNYQDKPMTLASLPDNWSAFNHREVLPWRMSRADAAAVLQRARSLRARGQATISVESVGRSLPTFDLQHLDTSDEAVLIAGAGLRQATGLRRVASGQLSLVGPLGQCREDGRNIRHHRVVAAFVNFHVADAAVEVSSMRDRLLWSARGRVFGAPMAHGESATCPAANNTATQSRARIPEGQRGELKRAVTRAPIARAARPEGPKVASAARRAACDGPRRLFPNLSLSLPS